MNSDVTRILSAIDGGDPTAAAGLLPLVYEELRRLAARRIADERPGQTLQATALVHEAYLRLVGGDVEGVDGRGGGEGQRFNGRGHFFAAAAEAMRRILVDNARRKGRPKHGGDRRRVDLDVDCVDSPVRAERLLALDGALERLAAEAPAKAGLVKLRYFAGLTLEEAAAALGVSRATADRYWAYAKAFLYAEMGERDEE
jgi:RNA polymerase sigma factor (TIGR02999 family)